jgi:hypothetical protein
MWCATDGNGVNEAQLGNAGGLLRAVGLQGGVVIGGGRVKLLLLILLFYHKSIVACILYLGPH